MATGDKPSGVPVPAHREIPDAPHHIEREDPLELVSARQAANEREAKIKRELLSAMAEAGKELGDVKLLLQGKGDEQEKLETMVWVQDFAAAHGLDDTIVMKIIQKM